MKGIVPDSKNVRIFKIGKDDIELKVVIANPNWIERFIWFFSKKDGDISRLLFKVSVKDEFKRKCIYYFTEDEFKREYNINFSEAVEKVIKEYKREYYIDSFEEYTKWCVMSKIKNGEW